MEFLRRTPRTTLAAATAALIFVALFLGYVADVTGNDDSDADVIGWLIVSVIASAIAAVLLLRFVPGAESDADTSNKPARYGLVLGVLSFVAVIAFWTGLPFAFGVPAAVLGAEGQARAPQQGHGGQATAALALGLLAIVASFVICIVG